MKLSFLIIWLLLSGGIINPVRLQAQDTIPVPITDSSAEYPREDSGVRVQEAVSSPEAVKSKILFPKFRQEPNPEKNPAILKAGSDLEDTLKSQSRNVNLMQAGVQDSLSLAESSSQNIGEKKIPSVKGIVSFSKIFWAFILILTGYFLIRVITRFMNIIAERSARLRIWLKGMIPVFRIIGWTIVVFIVIQGIFKPNWQTILALSASVGVAIGFAAQDILKNIFGGFTILAEKSFQVGDKIQVGEHYGEVLSIGFRSTKIVTADDSVVILPNSELTARPISNSNSGETNCQVVAEFYLPENIDFEQVRRIATEAAQISGFVYLNKPISVLFFHELKENVTFIKMRLKAYVLDIRYEFTFKSQMTEIVMDALRRENILK